MSFLKDHISQLKKSKGFGGKSWVKRGDIEKQNEEEAEKEHQELEKKREAKDLLKLRELSYANVKMAKQIEANSKQIPTYKRDEEGDETLQDNHISFVEKETLEAIEKEKKMKEDSNPHKKQKVSEDSPANKPIDEKKYTDAEMESIKTMLRKRKQPVKMFGESDHDTYLRLQKFEQEDKGEIMKWLDADLINHARIDTNLTQFQQELKLKLKDKNPIVLEVKDDKNDHIEIRKTKNNEYYDYKKFERSCRDIDRKEKCMDILKWIKKMMRIWEEDFINRDPDSMDGADARFEIGNYMQTKKDLKALIKLLYHQNLNNEILHTLYLMIRYSLFKDYIRANDKYYDLGIGNAPWPMGVTMVGIHERSGRSKIYSSQVKHILNDETQKKFIVSIKRLLTICQKTYPTDPSKNVVMFQ